MTVVGESLHDVVHPNPCSARASAAFLVKDSRADLLMAYTMSPGLKKGAPSDETLTALPPCPMRSVSSGVRKNAALVFTSKNLSNCSGVTSMREGPMRTAALFTRQWRTYPLTEMTLSTTF